MKDSMNQRKKIVCVIPARLESTRFPQKVLQSLLGKPLLQWVWEAANMVNKFSDIVFAIDAKKTAHLIDSFGGRWEMTSTGCLSGTDRLIELYQSEKITGDVWVNWQGDEPFATAEMIDCLLQSVSNMNENIWTLKKLIQNPDEIFSKQFAKVVCDNLGNAIYFSRSPIPCFRDETDLKVLINKKIYYKHVGIYAYTNKALDTIATLPKNNALEDAEKLEQLRYLSHGLAIRIHETNNEVIGIDTPHDLKRAELFAMQKSVIL